MACALASSSAASFADLEALIVDEVAGFRTEARAEIGVPLVLVLTEPDRATPFVADGVDGVPVALVRCAAPGEAEPFKGEVRPLAPVAAGLLELEDDMTLSERQ